MFCHIFTNIFPKSLTKYLMKQNYFSNKYLLLLVFFAFISCGTDDSNDSEYIPLSPVSVDLTKIPYAKLSDYKFFEGALKDHKPALDVIPYEPASSLFSDYAHKKRFVWLPKGTQATYNGNDNVYEFPVGTALLKTFYFDNAAPNNTTKIIETRLLIRRSDGWQAYDYVWNDDQTEATLETSGNGIFVPVTWTENGISKTIEYKVPSYTDCITCHKLNPTHATGGEKTIPIGPKPQNLNTNFNYDGTSMNQITKWKSLGIIPADSPAATSSTVDWSDTSKSLELRARSYIDINCAHCHRDGGHCDYTAPRFNFSNTDWSTLGLCMTPLFVVQDGPFVINGGNAERSEMFLRMNSSEQNLMMPIIGRTVIHEEGVELIKQWINSLPQNCRE